LEGVLVPEELALKWPFPLLGGKSWLPLLLRWSTDERGLLRVVLRTAWVVSAEGGGGRFARKEEAGRVVARQRKHSPVP
jgi:hypothetical protein